MTNSAQVFEFRTTPAGGRVRVCVNRDFAEVESVPNGHLRGRVAYTELTGGRWTDATLRALYAPPLRARSLSLNHAEGRLLLKHGDGKRTSEADRRGFADACAALLQAIAAQNPAFRIEIGPSATVRWLMGALGAVALLLGAFVLFAAIGAMMESAVESAVFMIALGLALAGVGLSMVLSYNPFRRNKTLSAAELLGALSSDA